MRQIIQYKLQDGAYQPYEQCFKMGLGLEGGLFCHEDKYLGILEGDELVIQEFIANNPFEAIPMIEQESVSWLNSFVVDSKPLIEETVTKEEIIGDFISKL